MKTLLKALAICIVAMLLTVALAQAPEADRAGNPIALPENVERIVTLAPSTSQVLEALGLLDKIVGVDTYTPAYVSETAALPQFDMMAPDVEAIAALEPDTVFTTGMSYIDGNPYAQLVDLGICVVKIPSSESVAAIEEDILFIGQCVDREAEAQAVVDEMQAEIDEIAAIASDVSEPKTVMFEFSALPYLYSCGAGTYVNELIELIGAKNVFGNQQGWLSVSEEEAGAANPDVIRTSVDYLDDPVGEITSREGWEQVTAIVNHDVYAIDNAGASIPNQHITKALLQIAQSVYPELYAQLDEAA